MDKDSGDPSSSWVMAGACFVITFVTTGVSRCNSLLFFEYLWHEGKVSSRQRASWPFAISGISGVFVAPVVGILGRWLSARTIAFLGILTYLLGSLACFFSLNLYFMIFFFGIVRGVGVNVIFTLVPAFVNQHFRHHRATAQGIAGSGTSLGTIVFSFLIHHFLERYALSGTMLLMSGIGLHALASCILLENPTKGNTSNSTELKPVGAKVPENSEKTLVRTNGNGEKAHRKADGKDERSLRHTDGNDGRTLRNVLVDMVSTLSSLYFLVIVSTFMLVLNCGLIFSLIIVDYAHDLGLSDHEGILVLLTYSVGVFVGKMGLGWITDSGLLSLRAYFVVCSGISGLAHFLLIPVLHSGWMLAAVTGLCGALQGSVLSTSTLFYAQHLSKDKVPLAVSLHVSFSGLAALLRPPIIGFFRDSIGSYVGLFQFLGVSMLAGASVWLLEALIVNRWYRTSPKQCCSDNTNMKTV